MEEKKKLVTINDEPYYPAEKFMVSISDIDTHQQNIGGAI